MNKKIILFLVAVSLLTGWGIFRQEKFFNLFDTRVTGLEVNLGAVGIGPVGGPTKTVIGLQTKWLTDLIPSPSFTVDLGSSALPVQDIFSKNASLSTNFSVFGTASVSKFNLPKIGGGVLADCDAAGDTLNWDVTTGRFVCGSDATGSVASNSLNFDEFQNPLVLDTNITIASATFTWDWDGTNLFGIGRASISQLFVGPPVSSYNTTVQTDGGFDTPHTIGSFETGQNFGTLGVVSQESTADANGILGLSYQTIGGGGSAFGFQGIARSLAPSGIVPAITGGYLQTVNSGAGTVTDAYTIYAEATTNTGGGAITSVYGISIADQTVGDNNYAIYTNESLAANQWAYYGAGAGKSYFGGNVGIGDTTPTTTLDISGSASVSTNFEAIRYASASQFTGVAFRTAGTEIDCNDAAEGLQWSAGVFTCRAWADADIPDAITVSGGTIGSNNISGTLTTTGTLTIGDNGDIVNFDTSTWDVTAGAFSGITTLTMSGHFSGATASLSGNFQTSARIIGGLASHSLNGTLEGGTDGSLDIGTTAKKIGQVISNIIQAVTRFFLPTNVTPSTEGELAWHTASDSLDTYDGSAVRAIKSTECFTFYVESPTASNPLWVGQKRFNDPFTISSIQTVASASATGTGQSANYNLIYGAAGSQATKVFTVDKKASTSAYPTYSGASGTYLINNSTILDNNVLSVVITSTSANLESFSVTPCGYWNH